MGTLKALIFVNGEYFNRYEVGEEDYELGNPRVTRIQTPRELEAELKREMGTTEHVQLLGHRVYYVTLADGTTLLVPEALHPIEQWDP